MSDGPTGQRTDEATDPTSPDGVDGAESADVSATEGNAGVFEQTVQRPAVVDEYAVDDRSDGAVESGSDEVSTGEGSGHPGGPEDSIKSDDDSPDELDSSAGATGVGAGGMAGAAVAGAASMSFAQRVQARFGRARDEHRESAAAPQQSLDQQSADEMGSDQRHPDSEGSELRSDLQTARVGASGEQTPYPRDSDEQMADPQPIRATPPVPPAVIQAPPKQSRSATRKPARRARLRLSRVDPWSVMKTSFLLAIAFGVVTVVSVLMVWSVLGAAGVWESINATVQNVLGEQSPTVFDVEDYLGTERVIGFTLIIAVVDVILLTAIATLSAFLYNLAAALLGGVEVTLAEEGR